MLFVKHSTRGNARPKISRIDFGVEVWLKAICFRHKQLLILPGEPGSRLARARVRGVVDAVRLGGNDQKRTDAPVPVLAPVHGSLCLRRRDVDEAARDDRRRRRCRERARPSLSGGGPRRAHAAPGMEVAFWRVRVGGRASGGFCARLCDLNGVFERLRCAQHLRRHPPRRASGDGLRGGRATRSNP